MELTAMNFTGEKVLPMLLAVLLAISHSESLIDNFNKGIEGSRVCYINEPTVLA